VQSQTIIKLKGLAEASCMGWFLSRAQGRNELLGRILVSTQGHLKVVKGSHL